MLKIGIDATYLDVREKTGVYWYVFNLINNLARIDQRNSYLLFYSSLGGRDRFYSPQASNFRKLILPCPNFLYNRMGREIFYFFWEGFLSLQISLRGIDVFHSPHLKLPVSKRGFKVVTINDLAFVDLEDYSCTEEAKFLKRMLNRTLEEADCIVAISEFTRERILNYAEPKNKRIEVVYYGRDEYFRKLNLDPEKKEFFRKKLDLPEKFILFVGSLESRKNVRCLLQAFFLLKKKYDFDYKLVLVGPETKQTVSILKEFSSLIFQYEEDVIFKNYVLQKDLIYFYNLCDLFVLPSIYEGFGLPLLEAMASGAVSIASREGALKEVAGEGALLFNPFDPEELASKIKLILENEELKDKITKRADEQVKKFSWKKCASRMLDIYEGRF